MKKYPDAEIHCLVGKQIPSKEEKIADNVIGWLTTAPFGISDFINGIKNADKEFYLVNQADRQFFVIVTDEFIESRQLVRCTSYFPTVPYMMGNGYAVLFAAAKPATELERIKLKTC